MRRRALTVCLAALAGVAVLWQRGDGAGGPRASGAALYDRYCLACHGAEGDGRGPAAPFLWPRPRDFGRADYKWRSTPSGQVPTDADLAAAIRHGAAGTSMHGFGASLGDEEIRALVTVVKSFAPEKFSRAAEPVELGAPPAPAEALAARGEALYQSLGCAQCHGAAGRGDGPSAAALTDAEGRPAPPYDLTRAPLRRPGTPGVAAIYASLVTGLDGTPMPSYQGAAPAADLWAVAAYVDSIRAKDTPAPQNNPSVLHPIARRLDREKRLTRVGYSTGGDPAAEPIFGQGIPPQGEPPASLAPAQASLDARQCARCHAAQYRQWQTSLHAGAMSPGMLAQLLPMQAHGKQASLRSCQRCHAPLAEQSPLSPRGENAHYDPELRAQGISCAGCHVRGWHRFGPPGVDDALLELPSYPLTQLAVYERSDFCLPCHQLPPRSAIEGKPLLNTYKEWLEGPYMRRGVQCQHCHMPSREHTWKGVHDAETFRQGIDVRARVVRAPAGAVTVRARVTNVGAGHYLPTTPTPAAFVVVELLDARGRPIEGARTERRIGRHLVFRDGRFQELADTRIPPGESLEVAVAWKGGRVADAARAVVTVRVEPDEYYERLYRRRLAGTLSAAERRLFQDALERAEGSHYVATRQTVAVP